MKSAPESTWLGTGGAVRSFRNVFKEGPGEPIRDYEIAGELERVSAEVLDDKGHLRREAISDDYRGLEQSAPPDFARHRRRIYAGGLVVLDGLCDHFNVESVRLEEASVRRGVLALLELLRPAPLRGEERGLFDS